MPMYELALVIEGWALDELDLGDSVAVVAKRVHDGQLLSVQRMAPSYAEALLTVVSEFPRSPAGRVVRIQHVGLAALEDIAARIGRTEDDLRRLGVEAVPVAPGGPPDPRERVDRWSLWDVANWLIENRGEDTLFQELSREVAVTEITNLALELRARIGQLRPDDRNAVEEWLAGAAGGRGR